MNVATYPPIPAEVAGGFYAPLSGRGWPRDQRQQQQQQQQHLVEFQGRTLCVSTSPDTNSSNTKVSCVLQAVFSALGVSRAASETLEVPWRLMCGGKFLAPDQDVPLLSVLRVWTGGLKGGKGGFGAMLRAMAKQVGSSLGINAYTCIGRVPCGMGVGGGLKVHYDCYFGWMCPAAIRQSKGVSSAAVDLDVEA